MLTFYICLFCNAAGIPSLTMYKLENCETLPPISIRGLRPVETHVYNLSDPDMSWSLMRDNVNSFLRRVSGIKIKYNVCIHYDVSESGYTDIVRLFKDLSFENANELYLMNDVFDVDVPKMETVGVSNGTLNKMYFYCTECCIFVNWKDYESLVSGHNH